MSSGRRHMAGVLPLGQDASSRYGPWIVATALYVAALGLAAAMAIGTVERSWQSTLSGSISVQIPASSGDREQDVAEIVSLLRATPAIAETAPIDEAVARSLLEPWLGAGAQLEALPLPTLIDVRLRPAARLDIDALEVALDAAVPGTRIDDHGLWVARMLRFTRVLQVFCAAIAAVFGLITIMTVIFATRAGLTAHREAIRILQLIGAQDSYLARPFVAHSRNFAIKGGAIGCALAAVTLILLSRYAPLGNALMLPEMMLFPIQWVILGCLPVVAAVIGMATARITAMRALSRVP